MKLLVFDFETTGLTLHPDASIAKQPKAIEFGGVLIDSKTESIEEECSLLIHPGETLDPEITKITGLTDADLKGAPPFVEILPQLVRLFSAADCVVAHNLPFDRAVLRAELLRAHAASPLAAEVRMPKHQICTVGLYTELFGRNPRLIELYEHVMRKPLPQTHRALDDAKALAEIVITERLWDVLETEGDEHEA